MKCDSLCEVQFFTDTLCHFVSVRDNKTYGIVCTYTHHHKTASVSPKIGIYMYYIQIFLIAPGSPKVPYVLKIRLD